MKDINVGHLTWQNAKAGIESIINSNNKEVISSLEQVNSSSDAKLPLAGGVMTGEITLAEGTTSIAPLGFISGTLKTTPEAGDIEFVTDDFFATISTGDARKAFVLDDGARLTSGKIPVATTNGRLEDLTPQTELTDELTTITHTAPTTPDYAIQNFTDTSPFGFVTADEANTVLSVIANLQIRVYELESKLVSFGLLVDTD